MDETYIQLAPDRGGVPSVVPIERLTVADVRARPSCTPITPSGSRWLDRLPLPRERKTRDSGDVRF